MGFNAGMCDQCGQPTKERVETATGRLLCQRCADDVTAGAAAVMRGGGAGEAVAIRGWLQRVRQWRFRGRAG